MRNLILAGAVAATLGVAGVASAGPLNPLLTINSSGDFVGPNAGTCLIGGVGFSCIAGEGAAVNDQIGKKVAGTTVPDTAVQHLDWIVIHTGGGKVGVSDDYTYLYQVENSSIAGLTSSNTTSFFGKYVLGSEFGGSNSGIPPLGDLDDPNSMTSTGHNSVSFPNLAVAHFTACADPAVPCNGPTKGERELSPELKGIQPQAVGPDGFQLAAIFLPPGSSVAPGAESTIYGALGSLPVYGTFATIGKGFTWNSDINNPCTTEATDTAKTCEQGMRVAVPGVPEPASLLLLASGLFGLGAWARRRRQS